MDSWALGVLLYTLVYGTMPFDGGDHKNLIRQISNGEYKEPTQSSGTAGTFASVFVTLEKQTDYILKRVLECHKLNLPNPLQLDHRTQL